MTRLPFIALDRRRFLKRAGAAAAGLGLAPGLSFAAAPGDRRLVVLILRGALDGLAAVAPYREARYAELRGTLALSPDKGLVDLDGTFGLAPALAPLKPLWDAGEVGFVHAVASPDRDRSHFEAQAILETGSNARRLSDGWLNRALDGMGPVSSETALAIGNAIPLILDGRRPVSNWAPAAAGGPDDEFLDRVATLYRHDPALADALARARDTHRLADGADLADTAMAGDMAGSPKRPRPRGSSFTDLAGMAGDLIAAPNGPRIAVFDLGGFDTHADQGTVDGRLAPRLKDLAGGILALKARLGPVWSRTMVLGLTEFGRTVRVNGTGGTDHGTAGVALLAGGAARGGRVHGDWPGLGPGALFEDRDLYPATDLRQVIKGVLIDHLGLDRSFVEARVLPDSADRRPLEGLVRAET